MTQASPTSLLYGQALALINSLRKQYAASKDQDPIRIIEAINGIMEKYQNSAGSALTEFHPIVHSEIPSSSKFNKFLGGVQTDINLIEDQIDAIRSSSIATHNMIKTEILKAQKENARLQNKLKTLQLYSNINDSSILYFGDSFISEELMDWGSLSPEIEKGIILSHGNLSLGVSQTEPLIDENTTIKIIDGSNGFMGNNQEIIDADRPLIDPTTRDKIYTFQAELNRRALLSSILDDQPISWFEFENYLVPQKEREKAKNFNFKYTLTNSEQTQYLKAGLSEGQSEVSWAEFPSNGVLRLNLEIDLKTSKKLNFIKFVPFGLLDNSNHPLKIVKVSVSENKNQWSTLSPQSVWVVNSINRAISFINTENTSVGSASWVSNGINVRYIRFEIEQPKPVDCNIGHLYYIPKDAKRITTSAPINLPSYFTSEQIKYNGPISYYYTNGATPTYQATPSYGATPSFYELPYENILHYGGQPSKTPAGLNGYEDYFIINPNAATPTYYVEIPLADQSLRRPGPVPTVDKPNYYYGIANSTTSNGLIQKTEVFKGKRWVIGIRDITAESIVYNQKAVVVSKRFNIPGTIDRVALDADIEIPVEFSGTDWVKFYVSPNDGLNWYRIARIQDNYSDIPEIIAFNDPTHPSMRENGVQYVNINSELNSIRVKIEIQRPDTLRYLTPIIKSYTLKVIKRST